MESHSQSLSQGGERERVSWHLLISVTRGGGEYLAMRDSVRRIGKVRETGRESREGNAKLTLQIGSVSLHHHQHYSKVTTTTWTVREGNGV